MFQRALICTDFVDGLYRLVNFVPSLAAAGLRHIVFLHTIPVLDDREIPRLDSEQIEQAHDRLSPAMANVPDGVDVQIDVQAGRPSDRIVEASKSYQSDIVLLGAQNRSRLAEQLFGSTTQVLCKQLQAPVMVLRPQLISTYTVEELDLRCRHLFRYLLIPYDGSDAAQYLVEQIKHYAQARQPGTLEECLLCWVVDEVGRRSLREVLKYQVEEAEEKLAAVKADLESLNLNVGSIVIKGTALPEILDLAVERDISAIAISSDSMGKLLEWSVPSFAGELMRQSWHPVIYFPPTKR